MKKEITKSIILTSPIKMMDIILRENENITDMQEQLSYIEVFTRDTLEHFFCKYDESEENKDPDILRIMLHNAQDYKKYMLVIMDYINRIKSEIACTSNLIEESFQQLADAEIIKPKNDCEC